MNLGVGLTINSWEVWRLNGASMDRASIPSNTEFWGAKDCWCPAQVVNLSEASSRSLLEKEVRGLRATGLPVAFPKAQAGHWLKQDAGLNELPACCIWAPLTFRMSQNILASIRCSLQQLSGRFLHCIWPDRQKALKDDTVFIAHVVGCSLSLLHSWSTKLSISSAIVPETHGKSEPGNHNKISTH